MIVVLFGTISLRSTQQKTPPDGERGGEKQYKDYEKNPKFGLPRLFIAL